MTNERMLSEAIPGSSTQGNIEVVIIPSSTPKKIKGNKSRRGGKSRSLTIRPTVSTVSLSSEEKPSTSSSSISPVKFPLAVVPAKQIINISSITNFLNALVRFQQCAFFLFQTVLRLQANLNTLNTTRSNGAEEDSGEDTEDSGIDSVEPDSVNSTMVSGSIRSLVENGALSQSQMSLENNNSTKHIIIPNSHDREINDPVTIVSISNASSYPNSINTTGSSEASMVPSSEDISSCKKSKRFFPCGPPWPCQWLSKYAGILLTIIASCAMSIVTLIVKTLESYNPVSKVIWRLQGVLFPSLLVVIFIKYYLKKPLINWKEAPAERPVHWKWQIFFLLLIRGLIGCSADIFQYYSLKYLPLADSTVISFSTPIFVCIVAHFILGERCGVVPIFAALLTLCGVIVISKPPILTGEEEMNSTILLGNGLAFMCMICGTFTTVIMRYLKHVHFSLTMLAFGVFGTLESFLVTLFTHPFELPKLHQTDLWWAISIAGLYFIGQLLMTIALQHEEASVVSLVRTCDVLFAFMWQIGFLNESANILSLTGGLIVCLGVIIIGLRKWVSELPERSQIRRRLCFILR